MLWSLTNDPTLSTRAREAIVDASNPVAVSAATVWEISIKMSLGKLVAPDNLIEEIATHRFDLLPIDGVHAWIAGQLPPIHHDPFDRMLVAQAQHDGLVLVTRDPRIGRYGVRVLAA